MTAGWTTEQEQRLRELVLQVDKTASQIGDELGKSRASVIGKLNRMRIPLPRAIGPSGPRPRLHVAGKVRAAPPPTLAAVPKGGVFETLDLPYQPPPEKPPAAPRLKPRTGVSHFKTCQWIEGDPKAGKISKCRNPTYGNSSFCEEHHRRVYVPVQTKLNPSRIQK